MRASQFFISTQKEAPIDAELISHKLIRFCIPFFMLILLPINISLIGQGSVYIIILVGQVMFYSLAIIGWAQEVILKDKSHFSFVYHFIVIQSSILLGWYRFIKGKRQVVWNPRN